MTDRFKTVPYSSRNARIRMEENDTGTFRRTATQGNERLFAEALTEAGTSELYVRANGSERGFTLDGRQMRTLYRVLSAHFED